MLSKMLHLIMWVIECDSKSYTDGRIFLFELTCPYLGRAVLLYDPVPPALSIMHYTE